MFILRIFIGVYTGWRWLPTNLLLVEVDPILISRLPVWIIVVILVSGGLGLAGGGVNSLSESIVHLGTLVLHEAIVALIRRLFFFQCRFQKQIQFACLDFDAGVNYQVVLI